MELIIGQLKRVGSGSVNLKKKELEISVLEIGEKILSRVKIDQGLGNILDDGLKSEVNTKLWLQGKKIMAVQIEGAPRFYARLPKGFYFSFVFILIVGGITGLAITSINGFASSIFALVVALFPVVLFGREWLKYSGAAKDGGTAI